jgi:two-component system nitrogen regulation sensor histidine kinase NtrY
MKFSPRSTGFYGIHFLLTAFVFFTLLYLVVKIDKGRNVPAAIKSRIEKILGEKEREAKVILEHIRKGTYEVPVSSGITVFIYKDDTLRSWTGNSVPGQPMVLSPESTLPAVQHLENGWYRVLQRDTGTLKLRAFILISQEYPFQNDYLVNGLQKEFGINQQLNISSYNGKINIFSPVGEFLFSAEPVDEKPAARWPVMMLLLFLAGSTFTILFVYGLYCSLRHLFPGRALFVLSFAADLLILRGLQFFFRWPRSLYETPLFSPGYYFSSSLLPSFGDLLVNSFVGLAIAIAIYLELQPQRKVSRKPGNLQYLLVLLAAAAVALMAAGACLLIRTLAEDSTIPMNLQDLTGLNLLGVTGFGIIALVFLSLYLVAATIAAHVRSLLGGGSERPFMSGFSGVLVYLILCATLSTMVLNESNSGTEMEKRRIIAMKLATRRNPVTEEMFRETEERMKSDSLLAALLKEQGKDDAGTGEQRVVRYITDTYFTGYWNNYTVQITICPQGKMLRIQPQDYLVSCNDYFASILRDFGKNTESPQLHYLDYGYGNENYLAQISDTASVSKIYIEFSLKQAYKDLGYPELLVDRSVSDLPDLSDYSYGYYQGGQLVRRVGKYAYGFDLSSVADTSADSYFFEKDGLNHYLYRIDHENVMLIGKPDPNLLSRISPFSYLFIFFSLFSLLFYTVFRFGKLRSLIMNSLRNRLQLAFLGIILSSFIMVGIVVTVFLVRLNSEKDKENLLERALSVLVEMQHKFGTVSDMSLIQQGEMATVLTKFSNVFFSDINVYGTQGTLVASSRPQIFDEGLISELMNPRALERLNKGQESMIVNEECIGRHRYLSAYLPMFNDRNERTGYINLPYFSRQAELRGEVSAFMVAFINIYVLFILLGVFIAFVIAGYLTAPLKMLAQKIGQTNLGTANEKIEWKRQDEVGRLVGEYNRMLDELTVSAGKLASSERESAWREMARQVAHEIKNPLTPMKLSIQHLEKSWDEKAPDWDQRLKRFTAALVEQIDSLSAIATEFSDFAKMPPPVNERLGLNDVIHAALSLYRDVSPVRFLFDPGEERYIFCDRKQLLRVLTNLLNNAIQAIGQKEGGTISVSVTSEGTDHEIRISDNGPGIPSAQAEKIFHPNFTTKSGGTGLGLAIVREIVNSQGGTISFTSEKGSGTTFIITLPGI